MALTIEDFHALDCWDSLFHFLCGLECAGHICFAYNERKRDLVDLSDVNEFRFSLPFQILSDWDVLLESAFNGTLIVVKRLLDSCR